MNTRIRASRSAAIAILAMAVLATAALAVARPAAAATAGLDAPARAEVDSAFAISVSLPRGAAAVEGRVLLDKSAAEVVGLAPAGGGATLSPVEVPGGYAFGAFGLRAVNGATLRIVVVGQMPGRLELTVVLDALADLGGGRINVGGGPISRIVTVGEGGADLPSPPASSSSAPARAAGAARDIVADGIIGRLDLDEVRAGWELARAGSQQCGSGSGAADVNGDGCVDIVDIQAVVAGQGRILNTFRAGTTSDSITSSVPGQSALTATNAPFVVTSTLDTHDARNGDGKCADAKGRCTLRAAITESNWQPGDNRIEFKLAGSAPVQIQLSNDPMSGIQDRSGRLVIDGYTQPGSRVNTAAAGSNAIPGVLIRGLGGRDGWGLRITSANNVIRGITFNNIYRAVVMDGADAHDNVIVGNHFGYTLSGGISGYHHYAGVVLNTGANHNVVGRPAVADRNMAGYGSKGVYLYGPGTDSNTIQNNFLCMSLSGRAVAKCNTGVDMNFGPKSNLVGGSTAGERNVVGGTTLNGIEISHGWDPSGKPDPTGKWLLVDNHIMGNWIGFRGDGSYSVAFRSGQRLNSSDSNGINVIDGSIDNLVEGNWIAAAYDGINIMDSSINDNVVRSNIIGESPLGQPAPLGRNGINVRRGAQSVTIESNVIRNAGTYGIALTQSDVMYVRISRNIITDMSGPAIYLAPSSTSPGRGANGLQAAPVIKRATTTRAVGTGVPGATVEVYRASRAAGQSGLPAVFLGSGVVASDGTWSIPITTGAQTRVTALQIAPNNNTSPLSVNVQVGAGTIPPPSDYVSDTFERTANDAWGSANLGGAYTVVGDATDFDVANGTGRVNMPAAGASRAALLYSVNARDVNTRFRVATDKVPVGGNVIVYAVSRRTSGGEVRSRISLNANGSVTISASVVAAGIETPLGSASVVAGLAQNAGSYIWLRTQVVGVNPTTVRVKAWAAGQSEPSSWQLSATTSEAAVQVSGSVGFRLWMAASTTNAPVLVRFDDYTVDPI